MRDSLKPIPSAGLFFRNILSFFVPLEPRARTIEEALFSAGSLSEYVRAGQPLNPKLVRKQALFLLAAFFVVYLKANVIAPAVALLLLTRFCFGGGGLRRQRAPLSEEPQKRNKKKIRVHFYRTSRASMVGGRYH